MINTTISPWGGASTTVKTVTPVLLVSLVIAAANPNRKDFIIHNNSVSPIYISFGATATTSSPTFTLGAAESYHSNSSFVYRGVISAIRGGGSGNIAVTELG